MQVDNLTITTMIVQYPMKSQQSVMRMVVMWSVLVKSLPKVGVGTHD